MPVVAIYFNAMNKSNYSNASLLMTTYYCNWKDFPFMNVFRDHFKAFSEEKGETSIHLLLKQINDYQIDEKVLEFKYKNVSAFSECSSIFNFDLSFKSTSYANYPVFINEEEDQTGNSLFLNLIYKEFVKIIDSLQENEYHPFIPYQTSYSLQSPVDPTPDYLHMLIERFDSSRKETSNRLYKLKRKLLELYKKPTDFPFEIPNAVWKNT